MLSLLAKIRSGNHVLPSVSMESEDTMTDEAAPDVRASLLQLSAEIDRQFATLTGLLSGVASESCDDRQVVHNIINEYSLELAALDRTLTDLEHVQGRASRDTEALLGKLTQLMTPHSPPATPSSSGPSGVRTQERRLSRFATPLRVAVASTPKSSTRANNIDFDAFPRTPTLEQLGLSNAALAVVRDHHHHHRHGRWRDGALGLLNMFPSHYRIEEPGECLERH